MNNLYRQTAGFVFFALFFLFVKADVHKFYVSTTIAKLVENDKSLQITSQMFIDDLENALKINYFESLRLAPDSNSNIVDSLLSEYLRRNLEFSKSDKILSFYYLGKEYKNDIAICYLELFFDSIPLSLGIRNTLLFDFTEEQRNIFHFQYGDLKKTFLFHPEKSKFSLKLK
jgi:hypothetical protein